MKNFALAIFLATFLLPCISGAQDEYEIPAPTNEEILAELNFARTKPGEYADYLESRKQYYKGRWYNAPNSAPMLTLEGVVALDDAIAFLRKAKPLPPLKLSIGLSKAAFDFAEDAGKHGLDGHEGSDGSVFTDRISKYGVAQVDAGECVAYTYHSAKDIAAHLIIDDGVANRGHRMTIFNKNYKVAGIAFGDHSKYSSICVIDFAAVFTEN